MRRNLRRRLLAGISSTATLTALTFVGLGSAGATTATETSFANPGFESPVITTVQPFYKNFTLGSDVGGWTVSTGDVDLVNSGGYAVHGGAQALDLNGGNTGGVTQTFAVHAGLHYSVMYYVNTNGGTHWNIDVSSNGTSLANGNGDYSSPPSVVTTDSNGWELWGPPDVVPTGDTMTVTLTSLDSGPGGVLIDDVMVTYTDLGPSISGLATAANGAYVHLTGTATNGATGQGDVTGAMYRVYSHATGLPVTAWKPMTATDGAFDSASEAVQADLPLPGTVGQYDVCVQATDELGFSTETPVCLTNAFEVDLVASGPIVAHSDATNTAYADKGTPDYVVDAVAGRVPSGAAVGHIDVTYKSLPGITSAVVLHFRPSPSNTGYGIYYGPARIDLSSWTTGTVTSVPGLTVQFLSSGGYGLPNGAVFLKVAPSGYSLPSGNVSWTGGLPFDRGYVSVIPS